MSLLRSLPHHPPAETGSIWHIVARVRGSEAASAVFSLLDDVAAAVSAFETVPREWCVEAYPRLPALTPELGSRAALAAAAAGGVLIEIGEERLPARDWLGENQLAFPPLRVGRFFIYGSHHRGAVPAGTIGIMVDAATAFGTGEHPSTRACLIALERLARLHRFRCPLDIGTGTGILSIAAAKLLHRSVLASDIDSAAVDVACHNAACNGVTKLLRVRRGPGYGNRDVHKSRYDLILSNILARPLALLAPDLAGALAPGGRAVLSGLLRRQETIVLAPHRSHGIVLDHRVVIDGWSTLVMRRRVSADMKMGAEAPIFEFRSAGRPVRPLSDGRCSPGSAAAWGTRVRWACADHRPVRRFANDAAQYPRANGHRVSSARHRPARGAATRKRPFPPR
jgi:ribosomal protein L11 methyltransferase